MKRLKRIMALVIAMATLMAVMSVSAFAAPGDPTYVDNQHTITITTNGEGSHTYGAFQIFDGDLNAAENKLANIVWGSAMTSSVVDALKTAVAADTDIASDFAAAFAETDASKQAKEVAKVLETYSAADKATKLEAFADAINTALGNATTTYTGTTNSNKVAEITVPSDGYYFIKDTGDIADKDTATKFMLKVVDDIDVKAKDTLIKPDKEIVDNGSDVKANNSNIGDTVTYKVTIPVPDTTQYKDHFVFKMSDTLEAGLTFTGITSIKIDTFEFADKTKAVTSNANLVTSDGYVNGTEGYYTLYIGDSTPPLNDGKYAWEADGYDAVKAAGGQVIGITFNEFKKVVEANSLTAQNPVKNLVITYTAVVNDDATFGSDSNDNTVHFDYSNNPNYEYNGDDFPSGTPTDVQGKTPNDTTKTYVTTLKVLKVDGSDTPVPLPGAVFRITGTKGKQVVETGEKFIAGEYTPEADSGETVVGTANSFYKLKDGTYTNVAPVEDTDDVNNDTTAQYDGTKPWTTYTKVAYKYVTTVNDSFDIERTSNESGIIELDGLAEGTFTVQEITAPDGYNIDNTVYSLTFGWTDPEEKDEAGQLTSEAQAVAATGGFSITSQNPADKYTMSTDGAQFSIQIVNNSGSTLPSTGGIGTTIFYVVGAILVIGAGVILITRRRMDA